MEKYEYFNLYCVRQHNNNQQQSSMATGETTKKSYLTQANLEILMRVYGGYEHTPQEK